MVTIVLVIGYQIVQIILLPFFILYLGWRAVLKKPVFGNVWQRIGYVPKASHKKTVWIHGVSVGEILASARLIDEIKMNNPELAVYVTTGTLGGQKVAGENMHADVVSLIPFDFLVPMAIAFMRIKPSALIIIEGDYWPNLLTLARWFKIPTYAINARVNKRSQKMMYRFRWLYQQLLASFTAILTQTQDDVTAFEQLGISPQKLHYLGNIKSYNVAAKKEDAAGQLKLNQQPLQKEPQKILLVGSIHPGELDVYLELFRVCRETEKSLKMILVPRHFHWKVELQHKVAAAGFTSFMWDETTKKLHNKASMLSEITKDILAAHDVLLACTLGTLFLLYPLADIFYLGGTFVPVGGHNLLEPAVWGIPSVVGPYYYNTKEVADQLEQVGALYKVVTTEQLIKVTTYLLEHQEVRITAAGCAQQWLSAQAIQVERGLHALIRSFD